MAFYRCGQSGGSYQIAKCIGTIRFALGNWNVGWFDVIDLENNKIYSGWDTVPITANLPFTLSLYNSTYGAGAFATINTAGYYAYASGAFFTFNYDVPSATGDYSPSCSGVEYHNAGDFIILNNTGHSADLVYYGQTNPFA